MVSYSGAAAIFTVAGVLLARLFYVPYYILMLLGIFFVLAPLCFCAVTYFAKKKEVWIIAIVPMFLYFGFAAGQLKTDNTLRPMYPFLEREVEIVGRICSVPVKYDENVQFMLETSSVKADGKEYKIKEKIKVSTDLPVPNASSGVKVIGEIKNIATPLNYTSFDSNSYNKRRGVFFRVFAQELIKTDNSPPLWLKSKAVLFISQTLNLYIQRFPLDDTPLLKGIILNNKSQIPDEVSQSMLRSGTYRYIYSPYIHISIIIFILGAVFGNRRSKFFVGICIFVLYLFLNMAVSSAWKICLFIGLSYTFMSVFRINDVKAPMYLMIVLTGIFSPLTIAEPGFVISIASTMLIRSFLKELSMILYPVLRSRKLAQFFSIYLIILVGIYPLSSLFGYGITPWSFVVGLIITPVTALVYVLFYLGFGIYILTGSVLYLGVPQLVRFIEYVSQLASNLPLAKINIGSCGVVFTCFFYCLLYCIYRRTHFSKSKFAEILTIILCIVSLTGFIYGIGDAELTFLSVGNSDCAIMTMPGRKTIMIDGGGSEAFSDYDIGQAEVIPYLNANGINKIDTIILSHYDKDHADGIVTIIKSLPVGEIFMPDYLPKNDYRDIIEKEALLHKTAVKYISSPGKVNTICGAECEFLSVGNSDNGNDNSLVARITYGKTSILFTGDISSFIEYSIKDTKADILKVPHHGSKFSCSESFAKRTNAQFSVISVGENNPYGHPSLRVVESLQKSGSKVIRTDNCGDIHFIIGKERIKRVYAFKEWFIYGGFEKWRVNATDVRTEKTVE